MRGLTEREILPLWERGARGGPLARARVLLAAACPELAGHEADALTVGARDAALLELRERTLGPRLAGFVACPDCGELLELELDTRELRAVGDVPAPAAENELVVDDVRVRFQPLTCGDVEAAATTADADVVRTRLAGRCVEDADAPLSEEVVAALAEALAARDPQAEILVGLTCPECDHAWQTVFDIGTFLWSEVAAYARRLLHEVATLAHSFGWSETDILELSPARRRHYLELAS
jgi:hypothetical protein